MMGIEVLEWLKMGMHLVVFELNSKVGSSNHACDGEYSADDCQKSQPVHLP